MVRHVTLIAQYLLVRALLPSTHAARTMLALACGYILAEITVWLLCTSLSVASEFTRRLFALDTKHFVNKLDETVLRSIG